MRLIPSWLKGHEDWHLCLSSPPLTLPSSFFASGKPLFFAGWSMASFNLTVDDSSPLISYSNGDWRDDTNDTLITQYSEASLHSTSSSGTSASFSFVGTGVYLIGGHRPDYGSYSVTLDGATTQGSANAATPAILPLASFRDLSMGRHTVVLTNLGNALDLDQIIVETKVGTTGQELGLGTIDDSNSTITYLPNSQAWSQTSGDQFLNKSIHSSQATGAQASLTFDGEAVALFGTNSENHASYNVSIDDEPAVTISNQATRLHTQSVVYFTSGLKPGQHKLLLTSLSPSNGGAQGIIDVDQLTAFRGVTTSKALAASSQSNGNKRAVFGAIAGLIIGIIALLITIFLLLRYLRRRRRDDAELGEKGQAELPHRRVLKKKTSSTSTNSIKGHSWHLPLQAPPPLTSPTDPFHSDSKGNSGDFSTSEFYEVPLRGAMFPSRPSVTESILSSQYGPTYPWVVS